MTRWVSVVLLSALLQQADPETRIVNYLKANVRPGQAVTVADLTRVFKTPEEQAALSRLFNTFFKVPITVAQMYSRTKKIPTLRELSDQFQFRVPGEMDVVLRVMEADPRVPRFMTRDPRTGEITSVDVAKIQADPNFGRLIERSIAGWEGRAAPGFTIKSFSGTDLNSTALNGQPHLVYFWFTNCPPCVQSTPLLVALNAKYSAQGFKIVGVNADHVLELPYSDAVRAEFLKKQGVTFMEGHLTPQMQLDYGGVSAFPTMFFVNRKGIIVKQTVSFQDRPTLEAAIQAALRP
jgi:cytochrome c biogenesis protein CcmG/thiol:disulfide interchange protein DsbE